MTALRLLAALLLSLAAAASAEPEVPLPEYFSGKVKEALKAPPYVYLRLATAKGETWAAVPLQGDGPRVGAMVLVVEAMAMEKFESKTLRRTFEVVWFGALGGPAAKGAPPALAPAAVAPAEPEPAEPEPSEHESAEPAPEVAPEPPPDPRGPPVFTDGEIGWWDVHVDEPTFDEKPNACVATYGEEASLREVAGKAGAGLCSVPAPGGAAIQSEVEAALEENHARPPSRRKKPAAIYATFFPRFDCPKGLAPAATGAGDLVCQRAMTAAQLCPGATLRGGACVGKPSCGDGQSLPAATKGRFPGCFTCPAGTALDLKETLAWEVNRGAAKHLGRLLCRGKLP